MRFHPLPTVLLLTLSAAGCGVSGSDDEADSTPPPTAAEIGAEPAPMTVIAADRTDDPDAASIVAGSAADERYFRTVESAVETLSLEVESLFETPLGRQTEEIANRLQVDGTRAGVPTAEEDAAMREFFTTFWTGAAGHVAVLADDLRFLDPPDAADGEHEAYVAALDAMVDSTDQRVDDIRTRDAADLTTILWEPDEQLAAVEATCADLAAVADRMGIDADACP